MTGDTPRLGMLLKGYPRLSETFVLNELKLLEEMGIPLCIISMRPPRESVHHPCVASIQAPVHYLPEHFFRNLHIFLWHGLLTALARPRRFARAFLHMLGRLPGSSSRVATVKHLFQAAVLARTVCRRHELARVHAHFAHSPTSVAQHLSLLTGIPFSFTAHAKDIYTQRPERLKDKIAAAEFVVTCTRHNQAHLRRILPEKPIHCVHHGIDLSLFHPNGRPVASRPPYVLLTVARFVEKKGLPTVLAALALLRDQGLAFRHVLVGDGPRRKDVLALIDKLRLTDRVELVGAVARDRVLELFAQADCFVLGCQIGKDGDRDGIPNVLAEAMAMGVPVAATDVSAIPELVEHDVSGLLAPCQDPATLAAHIRRCCEDQAFRARCVPAARARVEAMFDFRRCILDLVALHEAAGVPRLASPAGAGTAAGPFCVEPLDAVQGSGQPD